MARRQIATRKAFRQWLIDRHDKTIGKQHIVHSCAIAQFLLEKMPNAVEADVGGGDEWSYWNGEKHVDMPPRRWVERVIITFDNLPGVPVGADLLKALGWTHGT